MHEISPRYISDLINKINQELWNRFHSYSMVKCYMLRWQQYAEDNTSGVEYFSIQYKEKGDIDSMATLIGIDGKTLIRIAIDLDIHTPDFIPCVPTFRNEMKEEYSTTYDVFNKACKQVYEDASMAISLANSTLESLIKQILQDERLDVKWDEKYSLKKISRGNMQGLYCKR